MLRLIKYLKPYTLLILAAIALLFVQANADLALPDYLSRIVNYGIQQGGVENVVPQAIRQSQMDKLVLFMSPADKDLVLEKYTLVDRDSPNYETYQKMYPVLATEPVYVQNKITRAETDALIPVLGKAWLAVSFLQQAMEDPSKAAGMSQGMGFDLSKIPAGTDIFVLLSKMPAPQREAMSAAMDKQFAALGTSMINQMAVGVVKEEYIALGMDTAKLQTNYILQVGGLMLLVTLISGVATVIVGYLAARTSAGFARDVRRQVFTKVENFSNAEFDKFSTASLITRSTNDITQVQMVVMMILRMMIYAPIIGIGGIFRAVNKATSMWWIIAVAVGVLLTLIVIVFVIALPKFKSIQGLIDRLNLVTRENLTGMMVIRAFNRQDFELTRFDKANRDLTGVMLFVSRVMVVVMPVMMLIMNGISLLIIWVGAHQVAEAHIQVGDMMAFLQYAMQIVFAFLMMSMMFIFLPRAAVSGTRIAEVLESEPTVKDPPDPKHFDDKFSGTVEFKNVYFRYPGAEEDVLHDINFTACPGQMTAIIGSTGSGKSTIVNLIPRFYDVTAGSILLDGVDIREVTQHELRNKIGYIPQRGTLFSGTIESNLRYANENADEKEMREAIEIAQAADFIDVKEEGLAGEVAQGGMNLSGGQKQRLAIARALLKKAPIYIFDDSFSALDFKTDAAVRRALKEKIADSTLLVVTQRVATIKNAEQIIVLDEGRIAGKGTHQELMRTCETYREIALSQLSKEELS